MSGDTLAISVYQPHASLIAHGVKGWETRPAPPAGWPGLPDGTSRMPGCRVTPEDELLIVSGKKRPSITHLPGFTDITGEPRAEGNECAWLDVRSYPNTVLPLSFGAVVAVARVTDVVPITHYSDNEHDYQDFIDWFPTEALGPEGLVLFRERCSGPDISDQLPYGDWTPGRWAWRLEVTRLREPVTTHLCPRCGGWGSCDDCGLCRGEGDVPVRGRQGVWRPDPALVVTVREQMA